MAEPIAAISAASIRPIPPAGVARSQEGSGFADALKAALAEVDAAQKAADRATGNFVAGRTTDVAATMIAVERASITFQLMLQVRNRLLEAYQEVQRLQV